MSSPAWRRRRAGVRARQRMRQMDVDSRFVQIAAREIKRWWTVLDALHDPPRSTTSGEEGPTWTTKG